MEGENYENKYFEFIYFSRKIDTLLRFSEHKNIEKDLKEKIIEQYYYYNDILLRVFNDYNKHKTSELYDKLVRLDVKSVLKKCEIELINERDDFITRARDYAFDEESKDIEFRNKKNNNH